MKNKPLVSLIIPVYNDAEFLHESLDSAVNQTLKNIEIICVNDGSTDNSLEILNEYAVKDSRVRIVNKKENGGTLMARKDGVAVANGEFTMFLDGDDYIVPNACETAYNLIIKNDVDILRFSFAVHEHDEKGNLLNIIVKKPSSEEVLYGRDRIQSFIFLEHKTDPNLWSKIFKTDFIKLAHSNMDSFYCIYGEDRYSTYYLSYYAKKMSGAFTEPLYMYLLGRGVCGNSEISLEKFEQRNAHESLSAKLIRSFLEREGTFEEQKKYLSAFRRHAMNYYCDTCLKRVAPEDFDQAVKILYSYWNEKDDPEEITCHLLTQLRNHVDWNKNLAASQIQVEEKDARIKELQDWNAEQLKAKEWFLSQIANKDARIAELQKNLSLWCKFIRAVKKIFSKIFKEK